MGGETKEDRRSVLEITIYDYTRLFIQWMPP